MKRFGVSLMTIPSPGRPNEQVLYVNLHIHETGEKPRLIQLIDYKRWSIPDAAAGNGMDWAIEVCDAIYQALTEKRAEIARRPDDSETNARPSSASTT